MLREIEIVGKRPSKYYFNWDLLLKTMSFNYRESNGKISQSALVKSLSSLQKERSAIILLISFNIAVCNIVIGNLVHTSTKYSIRVKLHYFVNLIRCTEINVFDPIFRVHKNIGGFFETKVISDTYFHRNRWSE